MSAMELRNFESQLELLTFTEQLLIMEYLAKLMLRTQQTKKQPEQVQPKKRQFGCAKGKFVYPHDFDEDNEEIAKLREENVNLQKRNTNLYRDCMNKERSLSESNKCISQLGDSIVNAVKRHDAEIENLKDVIFEMGDELMEANTELCFFDSIRSTLDEYTECMAELYPIIGSKTV